jgi:hypothetical protein
VAEELLVRHAAPTLAGLKAGNLISCRTSDGLHLMQQIQSWNQILNGKGVVITILSVRDNLYLLYVHRPNLVTKHLQQQESLRILCPLGYADCPVQEAILHLQERLAQQSDFPHEIGLFLGYPIQDVEAFIQQNGCNGLYDGCWKVYTDLAQAQQTFARYKKCTRLYLEQYRKGKKLEELTVQRKHI